MRINYTFTLTFLAGAALGAAGIHGLHAQSKPPAYVIAEVDVADQEGYTKEYLSRSGQPINDEGGNSFPAVARPYGHLEK